MTDKELLEYAAKAAGIKLAFDDTDAELPEMAFDIARGVYWNALKDDGDALRLAVKLGLDIQLHGMLHSFKYCQVTAIEYHIDGPDTEFEVDGCPYSATRRAIVRAAAQIGKEMK